MNKYRVKVGEDRMTILGDRVDVMDHGLLIVYAIEHGGGEDRIVFSSYPGRWYYIREIEHDNDDD